MEGDGFDEFLQAAMAARVQGEVDVNEAILRHGRGKVGGGLGMMDMMGAMDSGTEQATARVKGILDDLLSTENAGKTAQMRSEAQSYLKQSLEEQGAALRASENHREALEERVGELEIALGSLQREKIDWEEQRGVLTSQNTRTAARLQEAQVALDAERRERARRESDVAELDDQLRSNMGKHEALKRRWKEELKELQEQLTASRAGADRAAAESSKQIRTLSTQLQAVEEELGQVRRDSEAKMTRLQTNIQDAQAHKKSVEADLAKAEALLAKSERQRLEFRANHENASTEVARLSSIQQHCVALEQQLRESEVEINRFREKQAVMEAERQAVASAAEHEAKRQDEAMKMIKGELDNAHAEASAMLEERAQLHKDLAAARGEVETAHAAALRARELQDKAEHDSERALHDLNERLSSQIEARDQRLAAERASADAALNQATEQSDARLQSTLDAQKSAFAREKSAALAAAAAEHQSALEAAVAEAESRFEARLQIRVKEMEFEARAMLSETESKQQTAMQQQAFEARMTELQTLQKSLQSEKDTLFSLEERMEVMVAERVATMNENIPITQHQAILQQKLQEGEALASKLRAELLAKCEAEQEAAVTAAEAKRHDEYLEAINALKATISNMERTTADAKSRETDQERKMKDAQSVADKLQVTITEQRGEAAAMRTEISQLQRAAAEDEQIKAKLRHESEVASKHLLAVEDELRGQHEVQERLQKMLEDERRAWKAKVESEAHARHDAETHVSSLEATAAQVPLLTAELHKKEEALSKLEADKVEFMANLDRTMAQLTESVERREAATVEEVKQAAEKHIASVESQWREKYEAHVEQSAGQISSLKLALEKAQDMHEYTVSSVKKDHTNERALQAAEHEAQLVGIQNKLHSELTSHRSNHNLEVEQIKASHDRTMSELEDELEVTRKQLAAAKAEAEANHVSAENLAREKSLATERVSELTLTLEKARKDREEELRLAHAMRSEAESKHSETSIRHVELAVKHETVSTQLQKHEDTLVAERSAAKAEIDDLRSKLESTSRSLDTVRSELKRYKGTTTKISREKRIKLREDASAIHRQVGLVREDCNVLRTEVQMKLEMMKNDVLRELGELQWYHKEDIGRVVGSLQAQSRTTKQIYEDKMDRFREQLEEEYAQATERLKTVHQLEKDQLRLDLAAERDEHIGKLRPELLEAQSAHRSALQHKEHSERQLVVLQEQHALAKRELDDSRLAHTETKLDVASHRSNLGVAEDKIASLQAENAELGRKVEAAAVAEKELSEMRLTLTHVIAALGKRVQLPHGVSESLLARPASAATTGEALAKIDAAIVDLASSSVSDAEKKWEELVASLRAQLETMKGGEGEYKDKVRDLEQQLSKACSERDSALASHSDTNHAATEQRRAHEAELQRVRKEAELTAELAKADAITPYKSRIEAMQSHVDELERRTLEQLQAKERTVAEQLSSSVYMHEEALRNSERVHTQRMQEVERDAHAANMQLTRLQVTAEEAERRAASSKQELEELRRRLQNESVDASRAKEEAQDKLRAAEAELQAQRSEMGDYRRKVESERKNYKRLLKAQEQKMRDYDRQRAVAEERERQLYNTVREKEGQISSMAEDFQQSYEQLDVGIVERELTERLQQLNQKLTAAVAAPTRSR